MQKIFSKGLLPFYIAIILIIAGLYSIFKLLTYNYTSQADYKLDDGWTITVNNDTYENVSLEDTEFKSIRHGDVVTFTNTIPEDLDGNQAMIFNTYLSTVSVTLDGESMYEYATSPEEANVIIGSGCHFVIIPQDSNGKTVQLTVTAKQDNAFTNMEHITFVPAATAYCYYVDQKIFGVFISIFLVVLGIVLSFTSAFTLIYNTQNLRLTYIGIFSFFMGLWSMNNIKILQIFDVDLGASTTSEYFSLFAATIPIICLFSNVRKDRSKIIRVGTRLLAGVFLAFLIITTFLHFTRRVHFSQVLTMFHTMVAFTILFMLVTGIKKDKDTNRSERSMSYGFFILCLSFAADMIRFNVQKYLMPNNDHLYESFIPLGTLLFIILLLNSYISSTLDILHEKAQQDILSHIAYHDGLCDIYNRAQYDKDSQVLDQETDEYALINLDLNGLKTINDYYGHTSGDKLISTFAHIIEEAFDGIGTCYRMGGDEFLIIVKDEHIPEISTGIHAMQKLEVTKSKEAGFPILASYGIAYRSEVPEKTSAKIYSLADQRMYEMKQKSKSHR